jgi:hypothetical protein
MASRWSKRKLAPKKEKGLRMAPGNTPQSLMLRNHFRIPLDYHQFCHLLRQFLYVHFGDK